MQKVSPFYGSISLSLCVVRTRTQAGRLSDIHYLLYTYLHVGPNDSNVLLRVCSVCMYPCMCGHARTSGWDPNARPCHHLQENAAEKHGVDDLHIYADMCVRKKRWTQQTWGPGRDRSTEAG